MSNRFFNKNEIKIQSYMNMIYHNLISSIKIILEIYKIMVHL